jgi:hypothetical protein
MKCLSLKHSESETKILSLGDTRACIDPKMRSPRLLFTGRAAGLGEVGARWQRLGVGGSEREQESTTRDTDRRAQQHSAARFGFKLIQTGSNGFKYVQTLIDSKGAFPYSKN